MRSLEPAAGQFALGQIARNFALAFAHRAHRDVRADIFEDDEPVGVVLIDRGEQIEHRRAGDQHILRQRIGQIAQASARVLVCVGGICTKASGGSSSSALDGVNGAACSRSQLLR